VNKENSFKLSEEKFCEMTDYLRNSSSHRLKLSELEIYAKLNGSELLRRLLIGHLNERGVGDVGPSVIGNDGVNRTHKRIRARTIKTLFGKIEILRVGYSHRNSSSQFPLDAMLNLPPVNISYVLQKNLILEIIKSSSDESVSSVERWTEVKITTRQAKKIVLKAAIDFEEFYEHKSDSETIDAIKLPLIILTCDGKGIVMRYEDLREAAKKRAAKRIKNIDNKVKNATAKKTDSKRMSTVASVYEINRFVRKPEDICKELFKKSDSEIKI